VAIGAMAQARSKSGAWIAPSWSRAAARATASSTASAADTSPVAIRLAVSTTPSLHPRILVTVHRLVGNRVEAEDIVARPSPGRWLCSPR
jgi:hypothetical protein